LFRGPDWQRRKKPGPCDEINIPVSNQQFFLRTMSTLDQTIEAVDSEQGKDLYIDQKLVLISGGLFRTARLGSEDCEFVTNPQRFVAELARNNRGADLFTFRQRPSERDPKFDYLMDWEGLAVLPIESYEKWWKTQINDKTRNMVRKAGKKGVNLEVSELTDEFVRGIHAIYNECPIRQGKPYRHFGKNLEVLQREHSSFLDRSEFIGAYFEGRMLGFAKVVYNGDFANLMNIISLISERDRAPTNALIAKAIEHCAQKGIGFLQYGVWSRRSFGDFKLHHGFEHFKVPRYYVPLNSKGGLMVRLGLWKSIGARLPEGWIDRWAELRGRWYSFKYRKFLK